MFLLTDNKNILLKNKRVVPKWQKPVMFDPYLLHASPLGTAVYNIETQTQKVTTFAENLYLLTLLRNAN